MRTIDLVGMKFGSLTVKAMMPQSKCLCDCECGASGFVTARYSVRKGLTRTCGCRRNLGANVTHGESRAGQWTPEYRAWVNMITRCHNPKATRFKDWGGRGIQVHQEWRDDYARFLAHVGRKTSPKHSLDRFPNTSGNYEPGNVRWATHAEQSRNQRSNRPIAAFGTSKIATEWAEEVGIKSSIIRDRLDRGWTPEAALTIRPKINNIPREVNNAA